ncbi:ATP-dependent nuclease [Paenibacillus pini]|uniref:ATP-dependent endonuclease n=1 Tax=Paenibacillus pini JCM 16418 TaxID=1236976 RepID=W7YIB1_9BACL|nr:AAA family ATPase [Paenibacillus pini]GAF07358.1 ATP-dependent endonuclease [Paenibacillus pini JCM 16418]
MLERVIIDNYKSFMHFEISLRNDVNIIVGDNEAGKSSLLEAINIALTGQLGGKNIMFELSPHLFNIHAVKTYIEELQRGQNPTLPEIRIELYLKSDKETETLAGTNNSKKENVPGITFSIEFNDEFTEEYQNYVKSPLEIRTIPIEYYTIKWYAFSNSAITTRSIPINVSLIDTTLHKSPNGADQYISKIITDSLDVKERVNMALDYRRLRELFAERPAIKSINGRLAAQKGELSDKDLTVSFDISQKTSWESGLTSYLDEVPFQNSGKGEQNAVKMKLAIEMKAHKSQLILIEEPENHLSFSSMNKLINQISRKCGDKQLIITTHSTYVLNKMGLEKLILLKNGKCLTLRELTEDTQNYFMKLPGFDTLRMLLAKRSILVEGPSDELMIQKAYYKVHGKLPIEDGVDVISVNALAFKRFLEIAKVLQLDVRVVTDNDGDLIKLSEKYEEYLNLDNIMICFDEDISYPTLEPQLVKSNDLDLLNRIFNRKYTTQQEMMHFMKSNKADCALLLFETKEDVNIPGYINAAIN